MSQLEAPKPGSSRPRAKLTRDGADFLTNYARTINSYPHKREKETILASLHAIPGNETYTFQSLAAWFSRHRHPSGDPRAPVLLNDETILFPKLTPVHIQQLRVLYKRNANPSDGIITFWAGRISAEQAEIAAWIQYQQEKEKEIDATPESPDIPLRDLVSASVSPTAFDFPRAHLPTPAESLSPQTRMPSLPPIAVKLEDFRCLSPVSSLAAPLFKPPAGYMPRSAMEGLPPSLSRLQTTTRPAAAVPRALLRVGGQRDLNTTLAASIRDSLQPVSSGQPPRTPDEFSEKFERTEHLIEAFMKKYDSGELVRLGWDSGLGR